jgi:hypothetical protein
MLLGLVLCVGCSARQPRSLGRCSTVAEGCTGADTRRPVGCDSFCQLGAAAKRCPGHGRLLGARPSRRQRFQAPGDDQHIRQVVTDTLSQYNVRPMSTEVLHPLDAALDGARNRCGPILKTSLAVRLTDDSPPTP